jgi:hypothetical protein
VNNKRVGTVTFGIFMIVLGALLIINLVTGIKFPSLLIEFWPLLLVSLGLEVLYHHYRAGHESKLRYDAASMLVLFIFGISAVGLYAFQISGIGALVNELGKSSTYAIDISRNNIPVEDNIDRIVVENYSHDFITIKVEDRDGLSINGTINMIAPNRGEARRLVDENKAYATEVQDNSLIIRTLPVYTGKWFLKGKVNTAPLTIVVPSRLPFELASNRGNISVIASKIDANWFIKQSEGFLDVTIPKNSDAKITANARQIDGNIKFDSRDPNSGLKNTEENTSTIATEAMSETPGREYSASLGTGGPTLNLINPRGTVGVYVK